MSRRKQLVGIVLIVVSLLAMFGWEQWGKERLLYDEVLVLCENVAKGTVITRDMLTGKAMDRTEDCYLLGEEQLVIGMQTTSSLHKGVPLFKMYFEEPNLVPDEGKGRYGMCIPTEWIASKPTALSRGDKAFFYYGKSLITKANVVDVNDDGSVEIIVGKVEAAAICQVTKDGGKLAMIYQ